MQNHQSMQAKIVPCVPLLPLLVGLVVTSTTHAAFTTLTNPVMNEANCGTDQSKTETCTLKQVDLTLDLASSVGAGAWLPGRNSGPCNPAPLQSLGNTLYGVFVRTSLQVSRNILAYSTSNPARDECIQRYAQHGFPSTIHRAQLYTVDMVVMYTANQPMGTVTLKYSTYPRIAGPGAYILHELTDVTPIPRPTPPLPQCSLNAPGGGIILDHGSTTRGTNPGSDTTTMPLIITCTSPSTVEVSIGTAADIPTSLPGLASKIAFDGTPYARNYIINGSTSINVSSTVAWGTWDSSSPVGSFSASGVIYLNIL